MWYRHDNLGHSLITKLGWKCNCVKFLSFSNFNFTVGVTYDHIVEIIFVASQARNFLWGVDCHSWNFSFIKQTVSNQLGLYIKLSYGSLNVQKFLRSRETDLVISECIVCQLNPAIVLLNFLYSNWKVIFDRCHTTICLKSDILILNNLVSYFICEFFISVSKFIKIIRLDNSISNGILWLNRSGSLRF